MLQNLRQAMRRQLRRPPAARSIPSFSRRRPPLWLRTFPSDRPRAAVDPTPPGLAQGRRALRSYQSLGAEGPPASPPSGGATGGSGAPPECFAMVDLRRSPERSASPPAPHPQMEASGVGGVSSPAWSRLALGLQCEPSGPDAPPPTARELYPLTGPNRMSRKLVLELAANLRGVSFRRYSSLGPMSPRSSQPQAASSSRPSQEAGSSPEDDGSAEGPKTRERKSPSRPDGAREDGGGELPL